MHKTFKGLITAIITPFINNKIDITLLKKIVERQIEHKINGIVLAGSTGEGLSLTTEEYRFLLKSVIEIANGKIDIIAGCSASNTNQAVNLAQIAEEERVGGIMISVPPYVKPTQEGIYQHFQTIHDAVNLPIILYSVPSRTSVDFTDDTIVKLSMLPRIIALKDASSDIQRPLRLGSRLKEGFNLLCGNDDASLAYNAHGGSGCISVASNIAPKLCKALQDSWQHGDFKMALKIHRQLTPLYNALFIESNPIGVKYAVSYLGLCTDEARLPLTNAQDYTRKAIKQAIEDIKNFEEEL
jgi:4-hydroxy-tetrahydrodipicolinate synthase